MIDFDAAPYVQKPYYLQVRGGGHTFRKTRKQAAHWQIILVFENGGWVNVADYTNAKDAKDDMHLLAERKGWSVDGALFISNYLGLTLEALKTAARSDLGYEPVFQEVGSPGKFSFPDDEDELPF